MSITVASDVSVMLLWLKYLKELEAACGAQPPGGAGDVKTMCKKFRCLPPRYLVFIIVSYGQS